MRSICGNCSEIATSIKEVEECYAGAENAHDPIGRREAVINEVRDPETKRPVAKQPAWGANGALTPDAPASPRVAKAARGSARERQRAARQVRHVQTTAQQDEAAKQEAIRQRNIALGDILRRPDVDAWRSLPEGVYEKDGKTWHVKVARDSKVPYAMEIHENGAQNYMGIGPVQGLVTGDRTGDLPGKPAKGSEASNPERRTFGDDDAGMYRHPISGQILKVYKAVHGSGEMCAQELVVVVNAKHDPDTGAVTEPAEIEFKYLGHASKFVTDHVQLVLADAKVFGEIYGVCMRCGRPLTKDDSITAGLGTTCITYFPEAITEQIQRKARKKRNAAVATATAAAADKEDS